MTTQSTFTIIHDLANAGMNLRQWTTNSNKMKENLVAENTTNTDNPRVLGLGWDSNADTIGFQAIGLCGNLHEWLVDYLKDWFQYTVGNGHSFSLDEVKNGVPQGSLLGLRLYTIYVNDLPNAITLGDVFMYADNTTLIILCGNNFDQVYAQLNT